MKYDSTKMMHDEQRMHAAIELFNQVKSLYETSEPDTSRGKILIGIKKINPDKTTILDTIWSVCGWLLYPKDTDTSEDKVAFRVVVESLAWYLAGVEVS